MSYLSLLTSCFFFWKLDFFLVTHNIKHKSDRFRFIIIFISLYFTFRYRSIKCVNNNRISLPLHDSESKDVALCCYLTQTLTAPLIWGKSYQTSWPWSHLFAVNWTKASQWQLASPVACLWSLVMQVSSKLLLFLMIAHRSHDHWGWKNISE